MSRQLRSLSRRQEYSNQPNKAMIFSQNLEAVFGHFCLLIVTSANYRATLPTNHATLAHAHFEHATETETQLTFKVELRLSSCIFYLPILILISFDIICLVFFQENSFRYRNCCFVSECVRARTSARDRVSTDALSWPH